MKNFSLNLDKKTCNLIIFFENISFLVSLIGTIGLYIFLEFYININLYYISIAVFEIGLISGICSFCFGVFFNGVKTGLIHK